jgi:gamma-glutamyltranspeptidase/glutathione hydrolase
LFMVTGSPGGRTIINTVLHTILNVIDFGMNVQEAIDAPRFHHEWLPDRIDYERFGLSPDTVALLEARGHRLQTVRALGIVEALVLDARTGMLEGGCDRRAADGAAVAQTAARQSQTPDAGRGSRERDDLNVSPRLPQRQPRQRRPQAES